MPSPAPAILFDLPADRLAAFAATFRRLSRPTLQFRWLPTADDEPGRVLVRVESPPSLVVDHVAGFGRIYVQTAAGDWAELGGGPGWPGIVPPGPFVPEIESLSLEPAGVVRRTGSLPAPVPTPLRLIRGTDAEPARLWVLRDDALGQLTAYCRVTHQQLLARFNVAVSATAGVPCVVLRAITTKGPPPVFVGPAVAFAPLLKLPNVFLPVGTRLSPVLRRDALRRALAVRPDRVEWLHPLGDGRFRVESLPDAAFRPLAEWIDFRVPAPVPAGRPWVQSAPLGVRAVRRGRPAAGVKEGRGAGHCRTAAGGAGAAPVPHAGRGLAPRVSPRGRPADVLAEPEEPNVPVEEAVRTALNQGDRLHHARPEAISSALERCQALEAKFLQALPGQASDTPPEQWAELAAAYDAAGNPADAALCWLNALWAQPRPTPLWAWGWVRSEARAARPEVRDHRPRPVAGDRPEPGDDAGDGRLGRLGVAPVAAPAGPGRPRAGIAGPARGPRALAAGPGRLARPLGAGPQRARRRPRPGPHPRPAGRTAAGDRPEPGAGHAVVPALRRGGRPRTVPGGPQMAGRPPGADPPVARPTAGGHLGAGRPGGRAGPVAPGRAGAGRGPHAGLRRPGTRLGPVPVRRAHGRRDRPPAGHRGAAGRRPGARGPARRVRVPHRPGARGPAAAGPAAAPVVDPDRRAGRHPPVRGGQAPRALAGAGADRPRRGLPRDGLPSGTAGHARRPSGRDCRRTGWTTTCRG